MTDAIDKGYGTLHEIEALRSALQCLLAWCESDALGEENWSERCKAGDAAIDAAHGAIRCAAVDRRQSDRSQAVGDLLGSVEIA